MRGHEAIVERLIAADNIDIDTKNNHGQTPLLLATANGYEAIIKRLIATDRVDLNAKDYTGRTPVSCAALYGYEGAVRLFLATERSTSILRITAARHRS